MCGYTYNGEFKDDKRNGNGIESFPGGYVYKVMFKDDQLEGNKFMNFFKRLYKKSKVKI